MTQLAERITIPQFFTGKSIFITGGTGFVGKALTEKLLRSCPECGPIYLLMRPKKGKNVKECLENILNEPLFERLRIEKPENISKINIIEGDTVLEDLGLNAYDRATLEENVSIVFHVAASVRFDDTLKYALKVNVCGAHNVVRLALNMKNLKVFMHVSTTFCNSDRNIVDEIVYPPHGNWRDNIKMIDAIDDDILEALSPKNIVDEIIYPLHENWRDNIKKMDIMDDDVLEVSYPNTSENPSVYNCSGCDILNQTTEQLMNITLALRDHMSLSNAIWYPSMLVTSKTLVYYILLILLHLLPAVFIDTVLYVAQKKPRLIKVQRKIYLANLALKKFLLNEFRFLNGKFKNLKTRVLPEDLKDFDLDIKIDVTEYIRNALIGGCKYLLHQDPQENSTHLKRLYILDRITKGVFFLLLYYFVMVPSWNLLYHTASSYF